MKTNSNLTHLTDYIKAALPWAHGHQIKALTAFVGSGTAGERGTLQAENQIERLRLDRPA